MQPTCMQLIPAIFFASEKFCCCIKYGKSNCHYSLLQHMNCELLDERWKRKGSPVYQCLSASWKNVRYKSINRRDFWMQLTFFLHRCNSFFGFLVVVLIHIEHGTHAHIFVDCAPMQPLAGGPTVADGVVAQFASLTIFCLSPQKCAVAPKAHLRTPTGRVSGSKNAPLLSVECFVLCLCSFHGQRCFRLYCLRTVWFTYVWYYLRLNCYILKFL